MTALAALVLTASALASPSLADERSPTGSLDRTAVARLVLAKGYAEIAELRRADGRFLVEAVRTNGAVFRIVLDARDGRIVEEARSGWARGEARPSPLSHQAAMEFRARF